MDISGAQLNLAAINAYNAQLQAGRQKQEVSASGSRAAEVSLSDGTRNRTSADGQPLPVAGADGVNFVEPQAQTSRSAEREVQVPEVRDSESRMHASAAAQVNASTFAARQAVQSYFNVSNF